MDFNLDYALDFAQKLLSIDSPSGYSAKAIAFLKGEAEKLGLITQLTNRGALVVFLDGLTEERVGFCAHTDTLGLMATQVLDDGGLAFTSVGGPILPTLDGEYCRIYTRDGKSYTGTILSRSPAAHVYRDASTLARDAEHMYVRLDEEVASKDETLALGIQPGDYICYDPKTVLTPSGFLKSRFLDDKLSCAILFCILEAFKNANAKPKRGMACIFTIDEEVGSGLTALPSNLNIKEMLGVDMGCVGTGVSASEYVVSICAKDSSGPYDYEMTSTLASLAKEQSIPYAVDVYPYYSSDVSVMIQAGHDVRGALIGSGVHASHGMERSHKKGIEATIRLAAAYLER